MQVIHDFNVKFTDRLNLHSIRLQNQIHNVYAKFKCR